MYVTSFWPGRWENDEIANTQNTAYRIHIPTIRKWLPRTSEYLPDELCDLKTNIFNVIWKLILEILHPIIAFLVAQYNNIRDLTKIIACYLQKILILLIHIANGRLQQSLMV